MKLLMQWLLGLTRLCMCETSHLGPHRVADAKHVSMSTLQQISKVMGPYQILWKKMQSVISRTLICCGWFVMMTFVIEQESEEK